MEPMENNRLGVINYLDVGFGEHNFVVCVAEPSNAKAVAGEGTHDVAVFGTQW